MNVSVKRSTGEVSAIQQLMNVAKGKNVNIKRFRIDTDKTHIHVTAIEWYQH